MFGTFLEVVVPEFRTLEQYVQTEDWTNLRKLAHKLKPTLGMVGLVPLQTLLQSIETLAGGDSPDASTLQHQVGDLLDQLDVYHPLLVNQFKEFKT